MAANLKGRQTMSEFLFVYRGGDQRRAAQTPAEMQQTMQRWMDWMKELGARGHLKDRGHPLETGGAVVGGSDKTVTDGPYPEKDIIGGYSVIEAKDLAQAAELSKGCPIFAFGGKVEVRPIRPM
jgi:hypothetical protein